MEGLAHLLALAFPELIHTAAGLRHALSEGPPEDRPCWLGLDGPDGLVAAAGLRHIRETSEAGTVTIRVAVAPSRLRQGLGSAVLRAACERAVAEGGRRFVCHGRDDAAAAGFAAHHGFDCVSREDVFVVDPRTASAPPVPAGVEIRAFRDLCDDPSPIWQVDCDSMQDEPGALKLDRIAFPIWRSGWFDRPEVDLDASLIAFVGGEPAAATWLKSDPATGRAANAGTGTVRAFRGHGLATLIKQLSLARAARQGVTAVYTGVDATNAPMQAITRRMGYRPWGGSATFVGAAAS